MMRDEDWWDKRYWFLVFALWIGFGILLVGVVRLSLIRGRYYQGLARDNKIEESQIPASRGEILDRKGRVMAKSVYRYFRVDGGAKIYEGEGDFQGYKFEGKDLSFDLRRFYPYGEALAPVTGYVAYADRQELSLGWCGGSLSSSEMVGRGGVENSQDCDLRGEEGRRLIEVDARGRYVREMGRAEPTKGKSLTLTVDAYWQEKVYKMLEGKKGAVVMSRPGTGEVLLMVSSPSFDPNVFSYGADREKVSGYMSDEKNAPLLNRTIAAKYHPGSTFKIVVATAGLESGVIDKNSVFEDIGVIKVGDYSYSNWLWTKRGTTEGMVSIVKAIKRSNDIFFYRLGEALGPEKIKAWATKFGLGEETGIELPGEVAGLVPDDKWKLETKGERWFLGNTYHMAIGQGDVNVTPLQVNQMTNVIANNGKLCAMTILGGGEKKCRNVGIGTGTMELIKEGMVAACKTGGTAWPLFNFKTSIACKTGTAEVGDGSWDTHAWLTAFAPADNPEVSITVLIERGGEGSDVAAPIVGDILKEWFNEPGTIVPRKLSITN